MNRLRIYRLARQVWRLLKITGLGKWQPFERLRSRISRRLFGWAAPEGHIEVTTRALQGMTLYVDGTFFSSFDQREYEPYNTELILQHLKPGHVVLDIGANAGYYSLLAGRAVGPTGRVYAFEPAAKAYTLLERNIEKNGLGQIVKPLRKAVSDKTGVVILHTYAEASGASSVHSHANVTHFSVEETLEVDSVSIDDLLNGQEVNFIKMDIEGHEVAALRGMRNTILRSPDLIIMSELNPSLLHSAGSSAREYVQMLESLGFYVRIINEKQGSLEAITAAYWAWLEQLETDSSDHVNILCMRR